MLISLQSAFDLAILGYYLISVHALPFIYNYAAIIITEFLIIAFWAATFSSLAALYTNRSYSDILYTNVVIAIIAMGAFALYVLVLFLQIKKPTLTRLTVSFTSSLSS